MKYKIGQTIRIKTSRLFNYWRAENDPKYTECKIIEIGKHFNNKFKVISIETSKSGISNFYVKIRTLKKKDV